MSLKFTTCLAALLAVAPALACHAESDSKLYSFTAPPNGVRPAANVISDANGNLYGTTYTGSPNGAGTVYELSPPVNGGKKWSERVLHHFGLQSRGQNPQSALTLDSAGNLYGVTPSGGPNGAGTVFMLTKPTGGGTEWPETVLHHFYGAKLGGTPYGALVFGTDGNLYGTTGYGGAQGAGIVFKLTRGNGNSAWTETVLYSFTNGTDGGYPYCNLVFDSAGNLYGTTLNGGNAGNGVVFELSPPQSGQVWTEQVLHSFDAANDGNFPRTGVIFDASGNLYGTTENGGTSNWGTVFELSPPAGGGTTWTENVLHSFAFTDGGNPGLSTLALDASGNLYGTTEVGGTPKHGIAFKLAPPAKGGSTWKETILHRFADAPDGAQPESGFIFGQNGDLIGTTFMGGKNDQGTVYQLKP